MLTSLKSEKKAAKPNKIKNLKLRPPKSPTKNPTQTKPKKPTKTQKGPLKSPTDIQKNTKKKKTANHKPNHNSFNLLGITEILEKI